MNCFPLESLLRAVNVERVDFFSLDVEGHEYKILKAFPFNKFDIKVRQNHLSDKIFLTQFLIKNFLPHLRLSWLNISSPRKGAKQ